MNLGAVEALSLSSTRFAHPPAHFGIAYHTVKTSGKLLRVSGIAEELSLLLGRKVDVVTSSLLRSEVSATALADAVPV